MRVYFEVATCGIDTPTNLVNEGTEGDDDKSFEVDDLYFGKARPNRVSIPGRRERKS